mgnify:FL=1|tara:strand:+ start:1964 stop:3520 length:1557 start_codon:yes stop_codon:yes gene_type:complete
MSLLPSTLLNATQNEDQTLEIHSEILEPLSHSQVITRWEIPHKNILDSDSVMIWKVFCDGQATDRTGSTFMARPLPLTGLYDTMLRARLFVNGKVISELNEVGKYLGMKYHFQPHEVKTEVSDFFSYADNNIVNNGGNMDMDIGRILRTPGDKELGPSVPAKGHNYQVECSLKLHQLFAILKDAQLDTNNIEGKIMIEIDWSPNNTNTAKDNVLYAGSGVTAVAKPLKVLEPRLILDFLTYNAEVQAQIKNTIWGDGAGINMPFREVVLVRKTLNVSTGVKEEDFSIGMTGRAIQKIWVAKVMDCGGNDANKLLGSVRSDLLNGQKWNVRVNDLMIYDRDVDNRAEEFNYLQQTGEAQYTIPPSMYERRSFGKGVRSGYTTNDDVWVDNISVAKQNATLVNIPAGMPAHPVNVPSAPFGNKVGDFSRVSQGASIDTANVKATMEGRLNYLGINLARYKAGGDTPMNAMRIGSTPVLFSLRRDGTADTDTTAKTGTMFFWVEYLKIMNLKNGQISVMDM